MKEEVTYHFINERIYVSVYITALKNLSIQKYYGMQVNKFNNKISFFTNTIKTDDYSSSPHTSDKNLKFIISEASSGHKCKAYLENTGLGMKTYSDVYNYAFVSGTKAYYSLVSSDKVLTLTAGSSTYWSGYYQFTDKNDII